MGKRSVRKYTLEFKQQAAKLATRIGVGQAARQLGVAVSTIHQWKKDAGKAKDIKQPELILAEENRQLRKEVEELKKVNYILKKAAAFFSQDHLK